MPASTATLHYEDGRAVLRFERHLDHPVERVWAALTATEQLGAWHPTPFELEPRSGGRVRFRSGPGGPPLPDGTVLVFDPPHALAYTWAQDELRFELEPLDGGCRLVLTHAFEDRMKAARDAAGWDLCLGALEAAIGGSPARSTAGEGRLPRGWAELNSVYEHRFGIPHELATPPPSREEIESWRTPAEG